MGEDQGGAVFLRPRKPPEDVVAPARVGDDLCGAAQFAQTPGQQFCQCVQCGLVMAGRLVLDQALQLGDHRRPPGPQVIQNRMIMHNRIVSRLGVQRRGAKRVRPDLVLHRLDTRAGRIGHGNRTPNSQDRRIDDIAAIVLVRARDIAGQREAW